MNGKYPYNKDSIGIPFADLTNDSFHSFLSWPKNGCGSFKGFFERLNLDGIIEKVPGIRRVESNT